MPTIRKAKQLAEAGFIDTDSIQKIEKVIEKFSLSLTPSIAEAMQTGPESDKEAIRKQFLPSEEELKQTPNESKDPIGDNVYTKIKGVVHRYPDRCLLMPISSCPAYCRFCFRREKVGSNSKALSKIELEAAYDYIRQHSEIWEVILTGGDPFILKPKVIANIFRSLANIQHVEIVRIHTRVPIVKPESITDELIKALKINKTVYVALHVNHPAELTHAARAACARFVDAGIPMLGQTVLLKDVNDNPEIMGELMRALVKNRIKPYYLHHGELAEGTSHFRTTIEQGRRIMRSLRGRYSGLCQPTYVVEIPGGSGKVPIDYPYVKRNKLEETDAYSDSESENYTIEDWQGQIHCYTTP